MTTPINNGDMSASIAATKVDIRNKRKVFIRCQWSATGSPQGTFGIKLGSVERQTDYGSISGGYFDFVGAQPNGTAVAGSITCEFESGAEFVYVYYTHVSGGTANATAIVDVSAV